MKLSVEHRWNNNDRGKPKSDTKIKLGMEHRWNTNDRGKPKYSEKTLFQCHFVHENLIKKWPLTDDYVKALFYPMLPVPARALLFATPPGFASFSLWHRKRVDEDEYRQLAERY
jgi:hypothetical protein